MHLVVDELGKRWRWTCFNGCDYRRGKMISQPDQQPERGAHRQGDENRMACLALSKSGFASGRLLSSPRFHDLHRFCSSSERSGSGADSEKSSRTDVPRTTSEKIEPVQLPELTKGHTGAQPAQRGVNSVALGYFQPQRLPRRVDSQRVPVTLLGQLHRATKS